MPLNDGTDPAGQGPLTGSGGGAQQSSGGRMTGGFGAGPVGDCVCPSCKTVVAHQRGVPCFQLKCPKCGANMTRQF